MSADVKMPFALRLCLWTAVFAGLFAFVFFMPSFPEIKPYVQPKADIDIFRDSQMSTEDAELLELYDDSPVFLATRLNFSDSRVNLPRSDLSAFEPGGISDYAIESYRLGASKPIGDFSILDLVSHSFAFSGFMQNLADAQIPDMEPVSFATVSVVPSDSQASVFTERLGLKSLSPEWVPVEFSVIVGPDGAPSLPMMLSSSGIDRLDSELEDYIARNLYRMKLTTGYYLITVSP